MEPPRWAVRLAQKVVEEYNIAHVPFIEWHQRKRKGTSGCCYLDQYIISINAGTDKRDQRLTFLHEMAHVILLLHKQAYRGEHTEDFYELVWKLYRRHRVPIRFALDEESRYRKAAVLAYRKTGGRLR